MDRSFDLECDAVVIGGGPGGSTAATFIAMHGHRVVLLEKQTMPAYKIGESLLPATIHGICPMLGVSEAIEAAGFTPKRGGTFCWGKGRTTWQFLFSASSKMPGPTSMAYQVERMKFDKILLDNAAQKGADVREEHQATGPIVENDRVVGIEYTDGSGVNRAAKCRYVVDASGHQSRIARYAGERIYSEFFQNLALFGYYEGGGRLPSPSQGNIFCVAFESGWFWYIPLTEGLTSVGAVVAKDQASRLNLGYESAMDDFIRACPPIRDLLNAATRVKEGPYGELRVRKDYSYTTEKFWKPGLALVGDAACFIDPVFSSGVHLATYSALQAARSINTCLAGTLAEERCFDEFEARYRREYANFYDFLLAFYDVSSDIDSYYWQARKILNSPESGNRAFIDLVAGMGGSGERLYDTAEDFMQEREGLGEALFPQSAHAGAHNSGRPDPRRDEFYSNLLGEIAQIQLQASLKEHRPGEKSLFPSGLVVSKDGLHWVEPRGVAAA